ncbi:MAG TPA: ribosome-binding factor A [Candidatus Paceibacterota bacterium]|jgi:ribosome-binding factor A|nr:ribosome-binding factor A [Candidatus Paceibacterota bacterium]
MYHDERLAEQIRELAAEFISREASKQSLITVTSVRLYDDNRNATVFFTAYPESHEKTALEFLKRKRPDFKEYVKRNAPIGRIPFFDFEIDLGEKNRQRIEELSQEDKKDEG